MMAKKEVQSALILLFSGSILTIAICEICITPQRGSNYHCKTIISLNNFCYDTGSISDNSIVNFFSGGHVLNTTCTLNNIKNLTIEGHSTTINCSPDDEKSGFRFFGIKALKMSDITFISCGAAWNQTRRNLDGLYHNILTALLFVNGSYHTLSNVRVVHAKSAGIYIYNVAGEVLVDSCNVSNASSDSLEVLSGNVIVYDDFINSSTLVKITNTNFSYSGYRNYSSSECRHSTNFSYLSGLAIYLGTPNNVLTVSVLGCTFSHNMGCSGGNMAVLIFYHALLNISNCTFANATAQFGGGLYVSYQNSFLDKNLSMDNYTSPKVVSIVDSFFVANHALNASGGIYIHWKQSLILKTSYQMKIAGTRFDRNSVGIGGSEGIGIHCKAFLDTTYNSYNTSRFHVDVDIENCTFSKHHKSESSTESSVILAANVPYLGINGTTVEFNNCTGILAIGSTLFFSSSTTIRNNTALTGGGIRFCSGATMYFTPHTSLVIANNSAQQTGGGIQVYSNCLFSKSACFFQFSTMVTNNHSLLSTVNFNVSNNNATKGGKNIYGGQLDYCYFFNVTRKDNDMYIKRLKVANNTISKPSSVSSDPQYVCFDSSSRDYNISSCNNTSNFSIYPGEAITLPVHLHGQYHGTSSGAVLTTTSGNVSIENDKKNLAVGIHGENITYRVYSLKHANNSNDATIYLKSGLDSYTNEKYGTVAAKIQIHFKPCPFGFTSAKSKDSPQYFCNCSLFKHFEEVDCSFANITKPRGSWLGSAKSNNQDYIAFSAHCPLDYCNNSIRVIKLNAHNLSQDEQCRYNRTGILCGSCPEGWSLVLGSSECHEKCSNVYLFLIVPFALSGILLVVVIHLLNLTVAMGTVCGLIFYANVIQDHSISLLSPNQPGLTHILRIFLSWLNLDLGVSICFYRGMSAFGKTMLLFVFPVYVWLISAAIIFLSNRYIFFTKLFGKNAVKVLSTLILLSYSKMFRVAIGIFNFKQLSAYNIMNYSERPPMIRWILDGNVDYYETKHIILLVIAVLFILLLLPLSISLLCIGHLYSLSNCSRLFSWVDKLKPFFDAYTGPFKDKARFWTGLLLLVRVFLLILNAFDYHDPVTPYYVIVAVCLVLSGNIVFFKGVYHRHGLNVLEHFFVLNIATIFLINTYTGEAPWKSTLSQFLVSSAFLTFLGIILYRVCLKLLHLRITKTMSLLHRNKDKDLLNLIHNDRSLHE